MQPAFGIESQDGVRHLVHSIFFDFAAAVYAVSTAHARKKQAEIVIDLRSRRHSGSRITRRIFLSDGDCRRNAVDAVGIWLFNALKELSRISRQGLNIAPLTFSVNGVKGKRGLARSGDPGHDRQGVVGDLKVNVLQIMNAGATHNDAFSRHGITRQGEPRRAS